jgi:RDD family
MRNSLYDALEVNSSSSTNAIQAALRSVVRRFWAVPRDASGDSEEAVRFAALAASILVDPVRRKDYDVALNPGVGAGPWRLPIANRDAPNEGATDSRVFGEEGGELSQLSVQATVPKALPGVDALAEPLPDGKAWASPAIYGVLAATWLLLWYAFARPFPEWFNLGIIEAGLAALISAGVLYAIAAWLSRPQEVAGAVAQLSRLAIIKWRREGSIFIGAPPPQHDTAWIFKLRLMELTRSAAGFITASNPWRRLFARLVDYALIAVVLYFAIVVIDEFVPVMDAGFIFVRSALVLPVLAVLMAIPVAVVLQQVFGTTPGKWLFSLQMITGVTRPADHAEPSNRQLLWARAIRVAWSGAALGFWPVALFLLPRHMRRARDTETDWEASGDSVVMARPLTTPAVATALFVLVAVGLILLSGWRRDYIAFWPQAVSMAMSARSMMENVLPEKGSAATPPPAEVFSPPSPPASASIPAPLANPPAAAKSAPPLVTVKPPQPSTPTATAPAQSSADAEMAKQTSAANARKQRIEGFARQAEAARRSGNYAALQGSCQRWTEDQPGSGEAWRCLGLAQFQNGAGRDALPALRKALKIEPKDAQAEAAILSILRP